MKPRPRFVTLKVSDPVGKFDAFENMNPSSVGFPAVTVMAAVLTAARVFSCPDAGRVATPRIHAIRADTQIPRTRGTIHLFLCMTSNAPFKGRPAEPQRGRLSRPSIAQL
jgi:hypothetical protein